MAGILLPTAAVTGLKRSGEWINSTQLNLTQVNHLLFPLKQLILISLGHIEVVILLFAHPECRERQASFSLSFYYVLASTDASLTHLISLLILRIPLLFLFSLFSLSLPFTKLYWVPLSLLQQRLLSSYCICLFSLSLSLFPFLSLGSSLPQLPNGGQAVTLIQISPTLLVCLL